MSSRRHAAVALYKALLPTGATNTESSEFTSCLEWLFGEVASVDIMKLAEEVHVKSTGASDCFDAGHASSCFFEHLKTRMPEVHTRLLDWRKVSAERVVEA